MRTRCFAVFLMLTLFSTVSLAGKNKVIYTDEAPAPAPGAYSQAIQSGNSIFVAGQLPLEFYYDTADSPPTPPLGCDGNEEDAREDADCWILDVNSTTQQQTTTVLNNIEAILAAAKPPRNLCDITMATVYLNSSANSADFNSTYVARFADCDNPPARATITNVGIPKNALLEISVIITTYPLSFFP